MGVFAAGTEKERTGVVSPGHGLRPSVRLRRDFLCVQDFGPLSAVFPHHPGGGQRGTGFCQRAELHLLSSDTVLGIRGGV